MQGKIVCIVQDNRVLLKLDDGRTGDFRLINKPVCAVGDIVTFDEKQINNIVTVANYCGKLVVD